MLPPARFLPLLEFLAPRLSRPSSTSATARKAPQTSESTSEVASSSTSAPVQPPNGKNRPKSKGRHKDQDPTNNSKAGQRRLDLRLELKAEARFDAEAERKLRNSPTIAGIRVGPRTVPIQRYEKAITKDPLAILSHIRSSMPPPAAVAEGAAATTGGSHWIRPANYIEQHNDAVRNIKVGIDGRKDYTAAFKRGWRPLRMAGRAERLPLLDVLAVLSTVTAENRRGELSRLDWKEVKDLLLYLAAESGMPGVADYLWSDLKTGRAGAERVVDLYAAIWRKDHIRLRAETRSKGAVQFSISKAQEYEHEIPVKLFAAYVAAKAILHDSETTFASELTPFLNPRHPSLRRYLQDKITTIATSLKPYSDEERSRALSWLRQVSLAQLWSIRGGNGLEVSRYFNTAIRRGDVNEAFALWSAVKEAFEVGEMQWIEDAWTESAATHLINNDEELQAFDGVIEAPLHPDAVKIDLDSTPVVEAATGPVRFVPPPPARLTQAIVGVFVTGFTRSKRFEEARDVWTWLSATTPSLVPSIVLWNALLLGYAGRGDCLAAEAVWRDMANAQIVPDETAYLTFANAYFAAKKPALAMNVMQQMMIDKNVTQGRATTQLSVEATSKYIAGLLSNSMVEEATAVLDDIVEQGGHPSTYNINLFLKHYTFSATPDLASIAKMLRLIDTHSITPDVFTFTMILKVLITLDSGVAVSKLIRIMNSTNVRPNMTTYAVIIDNLARSDRAEDLSAAVELLDEMERTGLVTNEIVYTSLITGFLRASARSPHFNSSTEQVPPLFLAALTLKQRMEERKISLNRIGHNAIIASALALKSPIGIDIAMRSLDVLRSRKTVEGGVERKGVGIADTWYVVLDGFAKNGDWSRARKIVEEMDRGNFVVRSKALTRLVDQVRRGGERR